MQTKMNTNQNPERKDGIVLSEQSESADLIRFDKNLASNGLDFSNSYQEDGQLIFDLIFYISKSFQTDLFGYGNIIPEDFAEAMGYDRKNLLKKHSAPAQIVKDKKLKRDFEKMEVQKNYNQKMSNGEYPLYTVLDNAIFRAGNENLRFSYEVKNFEKKETIQGMKFISLLSDVQKHYTEKNKIYYSYKLNPTIEAHLSKYFMLASPGTVKQFRKQNSVYLYFYLKNLQQNLHLDGKKIGTPHFNILCDIAEINILEPKDRKKKLIKKLKELQDKTDLKFDFKFMKGKGARFEYNIEIEFHANSKPMVKEDGRKVLLVAFDDNYLHGIKTFFIENVQNKMDIKWKDWKENNKYHLKEKVDIFVREYNKMFRPIDKHDKMVLNRFKLNSLPV